MKKLLIIAALAMCCCKQQTAECPYTFMGIPLDVTTEEFNQKLIEKGFRQIGVGYFRGLFFGYPCDVGSSLFDQKTVNHVTVSINEDAFDDIKAALMEKYSDTAKWRIVDSGDTIPGLGGLFHIFSTDDDFHCYIQLALVGNLTMIEYFNVDSYKDEGDRMQDL